MKVVDLSFTSTRSCFWVASSTSLLSLFWWGAFPTWCHVHLRSSKMGSSRLSSKYAPFRPFRFVSFMLRMYLFTIVFMIVHFSDTREIAGGRAGRNICHYSYSYYFFYAASSPGCPLVGDCFSHLGYIGLMDLLQGKDEGREVVNWSLQVACVVEKPVNIPLQDESLFPGWFLRRC